MFYNDNIVDPKEVMPPAWYIHRKLDNAISEAKSNTLITAVENIEKNNRIKSYSQNISSIFIPSIKKQMKQLDALSDEQVAVSALNQIILNLNQEVIGVRNFSKITTKSVNLKMLEDLANIIGGKFGEELLSILNSDSNNTGYSLLSEEEVNQLKSVVKILNDNSKNMTIPARNILVEIFEENGFPQLISNYLQANVDNLIVEGMQGLKISGRQTGSYVRVKDNRQIKPDAQLHLTYELPNAKSQGSNKIKKISLNASIKNLASIKSIPKVAEMSYAYALKNLGVEESTPNLNYISISESKNILQKLLTYYFAIKSLQGTGGEVKDKNGIVQNDLLDKADILIEYTPNGIKLFSLNKIKIMIESMLIDATKFFSEQNNNKVFNFSMMNLHRKESIDLADWKQMTYDWYTKKANIRFKFNAEYFIKQIESQLQL